MTDAIVVRTAPEMPVAEQLAFLKTILESSTEYSIVAKDLNGNILAWNEGAHRIYGYEAADVIGKSAFLLHHPDEVASGRAQAILDEVRANGKWSGELRRRRKNGTVFTALVTITLRHAADGGPVGFTMISQDLTESQRILKELKESHEYNRGLIESNIDALMTTDPLGIISDVNRQMCQMTRFPREELIGSPFKRYFTDPKRAEEGIRLVLAEDRVTNYELVMRSREGGQTVVSYNATTFRSANGKLKGVFAAARGAATGAEALRLLKEHRFDVITLDLLPDMSGWDVMRQVRAGTVNRGTPAIVVTVLADKGAGVGFAIHDFLEKPVARSTLLGAVGSALVRNGNGLSVLLVDDNKEDLKLFQSALKHSGYATVAKSSALVALRSASAQPPDLVVLDLVMPQVDGFEFLRRFRATAHGRKSPVIVLTGKDLLKQEQEMLAAMAQCVVNKGDGSVQALLAEISMTLVHTTGNNQAAKTDG